MAYYGLYTQKNHKSRLKKQGLIADSYLPLDLVMIRSERTTSYALSANKLSKHYRPFDMLSYHQPN